MYAQFVLFDGFDPLDVIAPFEVLHAAGMATGGAVAVELVSAEGAREVPSSLPAISLRATAILDPVRADVIVVPGAAGDLPSDNDSAATDSENSIAAILARAARTDLASLLAAAMERDDTLVVTVCGGSLILAMAGLLTGRPATTHDLGDPVLKATGAQAISARVVDDGDLVTGAGVTSGLDVALYLVEREIGPQVAHAIEKVFAYERRGTVWSRLGAVPSFG
ncbi:DJ-1/PfpI family protein [Nocardia terpenica]|uniref:Glutamine amidotransferase n=1 Tax=Nocardia terpenica TaxID=455432 RepID=A0A161WP29_9NOCA|nr:DJ-1/PfpI family protein [Nocardia terpenica]KZM74875.1 glutamine amidotransferase [Nocardia terpenica]NQE93476.1 DJ-1/PfpI family protein [Nocardia terpenica]